MKIDTDSSMPIFMQVSQGIEEGILTGAFPEGGQIPSITEFSVAFKINPATALKGVSLLVDQEVLVKKRGIGMFVSEGAKAIIAQKRKNAFYDSYVPALIGEAKRLEITLDELKLMLERGF